MLTLIHPSLAEPNRKLWATNVAGSASIDRSGRMSKDPSRSRQIYSEKGLPTKVLGIETMMGRPTEISTQSTHLRYVMTLVRCLILMMSTNIQIANDQDPYHCPDTRIVDITARGPLPATETCA